MKDTSRDGQTRRQFCGQAVSLALVSGALGTILDGCSSSPTSPSNASQLPVANGTSANGGVTVAVDSSSPLSSVGSMALVQSPAGDFLVAHTAQSSFVALSAICTHQTCVITGFASQTYVCPCHGSTFDISGRVLGGPAPASLRQFQTAFAGNVLTITA